MIVLTIYFKWLFFILQVLEDCGWKSIALRKKKDWVSCVWHWTKSVGEATVLVFGECEYHLTVCKQKINIE